MRPLVRKLAGLLAILVYATTTLLGHALHDHSGCEDTACVHAHVGHSEHGGGYNDHENDAHDGHSETCHSEEECHCHHLASRHSPGWNAAPHFSGHDEANCSICQFQSQGQLAETPLVDCVVRLAGDFYVAPPDILLRLDLNRAFDSRGPPLGLDICTLGG